MKLSLPALLVAAALAVAPLVGAAAPFAYVPNEGSGTLSVIDTASDQVVGDIAVGAKPRGTAVSPDGRTAYVSDQPNAVVVVVDLVARKRSGAIPVGASPEGVGGSPVQPNSPLRIESANQMSLSAMCTAISHALRDFGSGL